MFNNLLFYITNKEQINCKKIVNQPIFIFQNSLDILYSKFILLKLTKNYKYYICFIFKSDHVNRTFKYHHGGHNPPT